MVSILSFTSLWTQEVVDTVTTPETYKKESRRIFTGKPGKAAFYSLIIPGGGQVYNKRLWKVPLVLAGEGAAVYFLLDNIKLYNKWNQCYIDAVNDVETTNCGTLNTVSDAFRKRNTARTYREYAYIAVGAAHLLNIVDAFVDRHLIDFDTSDDLTFFEIPIQNSFQPQVTLIKWSIPLN